MKTAKKDKTKTKGTEKAKGKTRDAGKDKKKSKEERAKEREAKKESRKGDGSFPDILVVTKQRDKDDSKKSWFLGHAEDLDTLYKNDEVVAVYKLRRVSKMVINRKVAR